MRGGRGKESERKVDDSQKLRVYEEGLEAGIMKNTLSWGGGLKSSWAQGKPVILLPAGAMTALNAKYS